MDTLITTELKLGLWAVLTGLAHPIVVLLAFMGYGSTLGFDWAIGILAYCLFKESYARILQLTGAALFVVGFLPIVWFIAFPISALIALPFLTVYERHSIQD